MSTYTQSLGLEEITPGDQAGLWGNTTNNNLALIDQAVTGVTPISFAALSGTTYTLTDYNGAVDEARSAVLNITGNATGSNTVVVPNKQKTYLVRNDTGQNITFRTASSGATVLVAAGYSIPVFCDGNNNVYTGFETPTAGTLTVPFGGTGVTAFTAGFVKSPGGAGDLTSVTAIDLNSSDTTNILPVIKGGTGLGTLTAGAILRGAGTSSPALVSGTAGVPGQVLTWNGSQWEAATPATGAVSSVFGRSGAVTALSTDYSSFYPLLTGATFSGTISVSSGNVNATNGQIGVGTAPSLGYSRMVGSSVQLYDSNSSVFGNQFGTVGVIAGGFNPIASNSGGMGPGNDNIFSCGGASLRWTAVWAVNGTIQTSDSRLKTNVTPSPLGLNFISKLKPVSYKWISGGKVPDGTTTPTQIGDATVDMKNLKDRPGVRTHYGLIAQEVKQTLDELNVDDFAGWVLENKDDPNSTQALNYGQFVAPLIKAVQELKTELDAAKAEIAVLKAK